MPTRPRPAKRKLASASRAALSKAFKAAIAAQKNSHSPYSGCKVGATVITASGRQFSGCNVENSTYGATVCAERSACGNMVSAAGAQPITDIVVVTHATPPWPPCGICRQVLLEFSDTITVHLANHKGIQSRLTLKELLPHAFSPEHLQ